MFQESLFIKKNILFFLRFFYLKRNSAVSFPKKSFLFSLLTFCVFYANLCFSQESDHQLVHDLSDEWVTYDDKYGVYIPLNAQLDKEPKSVSLNIDLNEYAGYHLYFSTSQPLYFFINAHLSGFIGKGEHKAYSIDSLKQVFKKQELFFTFYNSGDLTVPPKGMIILKKNNQLESKFPKENQSRGAVESKVSKLDMSKRPDLDFRDFCVMTFVLIIFLFAVLLTTNPKVFSQYYHFNHIISFSIKEIPLKSVSQAQLLFILNHSLLLSFGFILVEKIISYHSEKVAFFPMEDLSELYYRLFLWTIIVFISIILKYLVIWLLAYLLKTEKYVNAHFYKHISLSQMFHLGFVCLIFVFILEKPDWIASHYIILFWSVLFFQLFRISLIVINLNKLVPFRNVYLFSYLCGTEALPLLIGFKYFSQIL